MELFPQKRLDTEIVVGLEVSWLIPMTWRVFVVLETSIRRHEDQKLAIHKFHNASKFHGFEEYDTPIVEYKNCILERPVKILLNSCIISKIKVVVNFPQARNDSSLARMIMAKAGTLPIPIKWCSIPQCEV